MGLLLRTDSFKWAKKFLLSGAIFAFVEPSMETVSIKIPPKCLPLLVKIPMWSHSPPCLQNPSTGRNSQSWSTLRSEGVPDFVRRLGVL
jgi:hypothetical protein